MLRYMLDTRLLVHAVRDRPDAVRRHFEAHDGEMCASSVTAMELLYGAHTSQAGRRDLDAVDGLLARLDILAFDLAAADQAGRIRAEAASRGAPLGPFDAMIAGHARATGLGLVTTHGAPFARVAGLRLEEWGA